MPQKFHMWFLKFNRRLCTQFWCFILGDSMSGCKTDVVWCGATLDEIRNGSAPCLPPVMPSNSHSVFFQVIYILHYMLCLVWKCERRKKAWNCCFYSYEKFVFCFLLNKTIASYHLQSTGLLHLSNPRCSSCVCVHYGCYLFYIFSHLVSYTGDHMLNVVIFLFLKERKVGLWVYPTVYVCVLVCVASFSFWISWSGITEQWYECFSVGNHPKSNYPHSVQGVCVIWVSDFHLNTFMG